MDRKVKLDTSSRPSLEELRAMCGQEGVCVEKVEGEEVCVLLHPIHSRDLRRGVTQELEAMLTRYSPQLGGLPLAYENPRLVSSHGWLFDTNPFNHVLVRTTFYVFSPKLGSIVKGVVKKKSLNHLGCLVHNCFNVSVLRDDHTRKQKWDGERMEEGDQVKLRLVDIKLCYYMPYFKAELDPESVEEAVRARASSSVNSKTIFDEDSGISSNEADESLSNQQMMNKDSSEEEEEEQKEGEDNKCERKKKNKKIKRERQEEEKAGPSENKGKQRKRVKDSNEEEQQKESESIMCEKKKKSKKIKRERQEEEEAGPSENKGKKKRKRVKDSSEEEEQKESENINWERKKKCKKIKREWQEEGEAGPSENKGKKEKKRVKGTSEEEQQKESENTMCENKKKSKNIKRERQGEEEEEEARPSENKGKKERKKIKEEMCTTTEDEANEKKSVKKKNKIGLPVRIKVEVCTEDESTPWA